MLDSQKEELSARWAKREELNAAIKDVEYAILDASELGFEKCEKQIARKFQDHRLDFTQLDSYESDEEPAGNPAIKPAGDPAIK